MKRPWCLFTGKVYFKMVSLQQALHANELRILKKMIDSQISNMSTIDFHKYWTVLETSTFSLRCYILWYPDRGTGVIKRMGFFHKYLVLICLYFFVVIQSPGERGLFLRVINNAPTVWVPFLKLITLSLLSYNIFYNNP